MEFSEFTEVNTQRCHKWHNGNAFEGEGAWGLVDWSNALCGEAGELANVVKKIRRLDTELAHRREEEMVDLLPKLADEIGDVFAYLDILATSVGLTVEECARVKFNKVSEKFGFSERI